MADEIPSDASPNNSAPFNDISVLDDAQRLIDVPERSKDVSEEIRCGQFSFKEALPILLFSQSIYSHVKFNAGFYRKHFYSCAEFDSASEINAVQITVGMQVNVAPAIYPMYEDVDFVIFGFLEDKKKPIRCRAILASAEQRNFCVVHITELLLPLQPIFQPRLVKDLHDTFKNWVQTAEKNKCWESEMRLGMLKAPSTRKSSQHFPTRGKLPRNSKTKASLRILELSPSKERIHDEPIKGRKHPTSAPRDFNVKAEVKAVQAKNQLLQNQINQLKKTVIALEKRVSVLEPSKSTSKGKPQSCKKVKMEEEPEKTQAPLQQLPPPHMQPMQMPCHIPTPAVSNMFPFMFGVPQNTSLMMQPPISYPAFTTQQGTAYFMH